MSVSDHSESLPLSSKTPEKTPEPCCFIKLAAAVLRHPSRPGHPMSAAPMLSDSARAMNALQAGAEAGPVAAPPAVEPSDEPPSTESMSSPQPQQKQAKRKKPDASFLEVTVPDGVGPGDTIDVELLQGGKASLVLPASSHAGTVLTLTATGALVEPPGPTPERAKCKRCGEPGKPGYCQNPHCQQVSVPAKDSELGDLEPVGILGEVPRGASMRGRGQGRRYGPCEDCG